MAYIDFYDVHLRVEGPAPSLKLFFENHLAEDRFSFTSIVHMPAALNFEFNNFVDDGYAALYGDSHTLTGRWMFKEAAASYGYPFPLATKEQVLNCVKALGEFGEARLSLGELFKSNLDHYGHGHASTWCKQYWGISEDVSDAVIVIEDERTDIIFELSLAMPRKLLSLLSRRYADLQLTASSAKQNGKVAKKIVMLNGKELPAPVQTPIEIQASVLQLKSDVQEKYYQDMLRPHSLDDAITINQYGNPMFSGSQVSVNFIKSRLAEGDEAEDIASCYTELTDRHLAVIRLLQQHWKK
ncbi:hypothetical protein ACO0LD_28420 [Undibacterium sp. Ji83W]|uniref:hypothetical protein n=1 Tax=Undibacterium sp. Ji83W TaxID=3413043 RepID=UPI003BF180BB